MPLLGYTGCFVVIGFCFGNVPAAIADGSKYEARDTPDNGDRHELIPELHAPSLAHTRTEVNTFVWKRFRGTETMIEVNRTSAANRTGRLNFKLAARLLRFLKACIPPQ